MQNCNTGIGEEMWPRGEVASKFLLHAPVAGAVVVGCSGLLSGCPCRAVPIAITVVFVASRGFGVGASLGTTAGTRGWLGSPSASAPGCHQTQGQLCLGALWAQVTVWKL